MDQDSKCNIIRKVKKKNYDESELKDLSREELLEHIKKLEASNQQLRGLLQKHLQHGKTDQKKKKKFDFTKVNKRHVLLKFYYLGWDYQGYVSQEDTNNTIENHLFEALVKCCLIENRETSNYHRCGRTDKGVSAFSQVISIDVRSKLESPDSTNTDEELPYCTMLNRLLPKNIQFYAWCDLTDFNFSARFNCTSRTYKYFLPASNLNVTHMKLGASMLVGTHDFRNFCKMDVGNGVTNFIKTVSSIDIKSIDPDMLVFEITANGFLWHQIRCITSILLLIGQEKEDVNIIQSLLDVQKCPCKPQYELASEVPLNLFHCEYDNSCVKWTVQHNNLLEVIKNLQKEWCFKSIQTCMMREMLYELYQLTADQQCVPINVDLLINGVKSKTYKNILKRETCDSLDDRIEHYLKKKKIEKEVKE